MISIILLGILLIWFLTREKIEFDYDTINTIKISTQPLSSSPNIILTNKEDKKTLIQMINDAEGKPILLDRTKGWICNIYIDDDYVLILNGSTIKINKSLYKLNLDDMDKIIKFIKDKETK